VQLTETRALYYEQLIDIRANLDEALGLLAKLRMELSTYQVVDNLREAKRLLSEKENWRPMWPSVPTSEQMADRPQRTDGRAVYMYLYWRFGEGPPNKKGRPSRKTYIGANLASQALARALVRNREQWQTLTRGADSLEYRVRRIVTGLQGLGDDAHIASRDGGEVLEGVVDATLGLTVGAAPEPVSPNNG